MEIREIERNIIKKYRKTIWHPFTKAIKDYQLVKDRDKIAVCMSGGKDSFLMAKCFQELKRHGQIDFDVVFLVMDPGYKELNRNLIEENAKKLDIPITIFETPIFESVYQIEDSPCYLCARMRRGYLYREAKKLGCNKIALGHHFDDVIETILMSTLYSGEFKTMLPKLHSTNYEGMELIRPMYLIREEDIIKWQSYHQFTFLNCACRFTEEVDQKRTSSKRKEIKELIKELKQKIPNLENHLFKSVENVNLNTLISYKKEDQPYHFLDEYDSF